MKFTLKRYFIIVVSLFSSMLFIQQSNAQENLNRPNDSEIKDNDLFQISNNPELKAGYSRIKIAENLVLDIQGIYAEGYKPQWKYINSYYAPFQFDFEDFVASRQLSKTANMSISISEYNGKAIVRFGDTYGEIDIKNSPALIRNEKQTFKIGNFKKIRGSLFTNENCGGGNNIYYAGGLCGEISFSANEKGDLLIDLLVEIYRLANRFKPYGVSYRYTAKNILLENNFTPAMSLSSKNSKDLAEKESLLKIQKKEKRENDLKIFDKQYNQLLPQIKHKADLTLKTITTYKGYVLKELVDFKKLTDDKTCYNKSNNKIDSLWDNITKYNIQIGFLFSKMRYDLSFNINNIEPHQRDSKFASVYLYTKKYNEVAIQLATRYAICDLESVLELQQVLMSDYNQLVDNNEYRQILEYLEKIN